MVPSRSKEKLSAAILDTLNEYDVLASDTLISGPERAKLFSWTKSAQTFLDIARELDK
jgi:hypothetical protein